MITQIFDVTEPDSPAAKEAFLRAAEVVLHGGLVVFPTETVYGLGADGTNAAAVASIYEAKGRPSDNPLIIHVAEPADVEPYAVTCDTYYKLALKFMPGPLTVVLPAKDTIPLRTRGGLPTVAVRCPSHPGAHAFLAAAGVPVAAPSANLSGSPSPTNAKHVKDDMNGRVDMILDGGSSDFGLESTIVKIEDDGTLLLLRPGKITPEDLAVVAPVTVAAAVTKELAPGEVALSPGMKYRHYAPKAPVTLLDGTREQVAAFVGAKHGKFAILAYSEDIAYFNSALEGVTLYDFGEAGNLLSQAHNLFTVLREADKCDFDEIFAPLPKKSGVGLALYNRMIRSAANRIVTL